MNINPSLKQNTKLNYLFLFLIIFFFRYLLNILNIFEFTPVTDDSAEYLEIVASIKNFGIYGLNGVQDMNRTPTYPLFILLINFIIGPELNNIIFFQIILDSLSCLIIFRISRKFNLSLFYKLFLLFLLITCLYTISYSQLIMTETLYTFLICLALLLICEKKENKFFFDFNFKNLFYLAFVFVLIILTRPIFVITILFFMILCFSYSFYLSNFKEKFFFELKNYIILSIFISLIISPWVIRNLSLFKNDIFSKNSIATPIGYKTNINMWKPFYMKEYRNFLYSYNEPFLMISPIEPPLIAKYIYENEKEDINLAFKTLNRTKDLKNGRSGKQLNFSDEVRKNFKIITERRYEQDKFLIITAPLSRIAKILFAPRLSTFNETKIGNKVINFSGYSSSKILLIIFLLYNFIYVFPALLFFTIKKNFSRDKLFYFFSISLVLSHIYAYTIWVPAPQSRYLIPLFPLFSLLTVITLDKLKKYLN